ncbi:uncharacterized protein LOC110459182 [Mizuhopecten yessoensis]|uniref:Caspase n=1 Tax=Mizuhopecten yessoensis TaxID=6573 RepID=A0A210Q525_MIZYE|nr:uncharacterized protein LOC110459182 [Mizuhopecten yessoensis]XP_021366999.1 uncharacterized protein LOC110459182 [Mizuhopecten yessoensis]OWF43837.1 Caspase [Mizuhopecten yessoensis]
MANPNSSGDSDTDLPGSETSDEVSHADSGFKKFYSSVKKLTKRVASISESPATSPVSTEKTGHFTDIPSSPRGQTGDAAFGNVFDDPSYVRTSDSVYDFSYRSRGVAVLIVNVTFLNPKISPNREYAKRDIEVFEKILKALNFTVIKLKDKSTAELLQRLEEIRSTLTSDCDCFLCLISSHGLETRIPSEKQRRQHTTFTYDRWIPTDNIIRPFTESYCRSLRGKPKLFFIQACRTVHGSADCDSVDRGITVTDAVRAPQSRRYDVRDHPEGMDVDRDSPMGINNLHPSVGDEQGDPNGSSQDLSQSIRGKINLDEIPFADDDDTEDSDDPDLSAADNSRVPYYPPRPRHSGDVDVCTIPCYPHCLVMFSSASERFAWSNDFKGGWLPYCMYEVLYKMAQHNFRIDLLEALTEVNELMAKSLETNVLGDKVMHKVKSAACIYHMLTKDIYLTPKYAPVPVVDRVQVSAV